MRVIIKPGGLFALAVVMVVIAAGIIFLTQNGRVGGGGGVAANGPASARSSTVGGSPPGTVLAASHKSLVNGEWKFYTEDTGHATQVPLGPGDAPAQPAYRFTVEQVGKKEWNIGFNHTVTGASFRGGDKVRLHFWARSPNQRLMTALMQKNLAPFPHCWKQDMRLTNDWKEYNFTFETAAYADGEAILSFFFGHETGVCELAGVSLERTQ